MTWTYQLDVRVGTSLYPYQGVGKCVLHVNNGRSTTHIKGQFYI